MKPIPPGVYNIKVDRVRKVRNKSQYRVHGHVVETEEKTSYAIKLSDKDKIY
jgi:hypothetical protein